MAEDPYPFYWIMKANIIEENPYFHVDMSYNLTDLNSIKPAPCLLSFTKG